MKTQLKINARLVCLFVITLAITAATQAQDVINTTLQFDGQTRQYRLYIPQSYNASSPAPLILNYHGFTNNIDVQYNQSNFQQLAEENQFIFVTPLGLGFLPGWSINNNFGGNADDIGFSDALIDKIQEDYNVNEKRIYATGFSNGGFFSYRLACELSPRIAAVASVAGSMTRGWISSGQCRPTHPTAVLQITGTNDNVININGNGTNESIQDVMEYWADVNNADRTPDVTQLGGGTTRSVWDNGDNGVTAEFIRVQGKGHSWLGGNINTSQQIWDFFSRFDIDGEIGSNPNPNPTPTPTPPGSNCGQIDFSAAQITSFSNQDNDGTFEITAGGTGLILRNNTWKQIPFNYTVTANTVLEFDFRSTSQGEIHAVGFESDNELSDNLYFKVHGTQNYGVTNFDDYSGTATKTYRIPVGNFYSGNGNRLVFINDNDAGSGNNSLFSNVRIYEGSCNGSVAAKDLIADLGSKESLLGTEVEGIATITMAPNPTTDQFTLNVNSESTEDTLVHIYTMLGQKKYEARLNSGANTFSASNLGLTSGIYLIKIQSVGEEGVVQKLMVK